MSLPKKCLPKHHLRLTENPFTFSAEFFKNKNQTFDIRGQCPSRLSMTTCYNKHFGRATREKL